MTDTTTTEPVDRRSEIPWDGHAIALSVDYARIEGSWVCPHEGKDFEGDATPACRRAYDPETPGGADDPPWKPYRACIPGEHWGDHGLDAFDDESFPITQVPLPVHYWFEGPDADAFHVRPCDTDGPAR
jgi:hypothetical protein